MGVKSVPFLDLSLSDESEIESHIAALSRIIRKGPLISGEEVRDLEREIASYCGRKHAVAVNSGTSALILALKALKVGYGDEVIVPSLSWIATANAVALVGAKPVFASIGNDLNICPKSVKKLISKKVKAIIAVDYTGNPVDIDRLRDAVAEHAIPIIEDAAQAFGAALNSKKCGSFGKISCFSLNPIKIFGALGEAGIILTDSDKITHALQILRESGLKDRNDLFEPSFNARMDTLQAGFLLNRFPRIEENLAKRRCNARYYFENLPSPILHPEVAAGALHSFYTYTVKTPHRDALKLYLAQCGVETQIQHPILMCDQLAYRQCRRDPDIDPNITKEILSLPINERLGNPELQYVTDHINKFFLKENDTRRI